MTTLKPIGVEVLISCVLNLLHHLADVHGWSCLVYPRWETIRIIGVIMLGISALGDHYLELYDTVLLGISALGDC